jgi:hypothetical protein
MVEDWIAIVGAGFIPLSIIIFQMTDNYLLAQLPFILYWFTAGILSMMRAYGKH